MSTTPVKPVKPLRRTYFGIVAFLTSLFAVMAIGSNLGVSQMNITPEDFNQLNSITALLYCILTPLAFALGVLGFIFKNDFKILSGLALVIAAIPFLVIASRLLSSIIAANN
jgi:hypothetical protein